MSYQSYYAPMPYAPANHYPSGDLTAAALQMGKVGAVVGLCGGAAAALHRLRAGEIEPTAAALVALRAGVAAGVATAAATLVASQFRGSVLPLAATLLTGTAVMYAIADRANGDDAPAGVPATTD